VSGLRRLRGRQILGRAHLAGDLVDVIEEFLRYHPDWPQAAKMRQAIAELRP